MKNTNEVSYKKLKYTCNPDIFNFETTDELNTNYKGVGQERGIKSLEFGLRVDTNGYNLYLEGPTGSGKTTYTRNYLKKLSKSKKTPPDWCYIYNFDNPNEPIAVNFRSLVPELSKLERYTHLIHSYPAKLLANIPFYFFATDELCPQVLNYYMKKPRNCQVKNHHKPQKAS